MKFPTSSKLYLNILKATVCGVLWCIIICLIVVFFVFFFFLWWFMLSDCYYLDFCAIYWLHILVLPGDMYRKVMNKTVTSLLNVINSQICYPYPSFHPCRDLNDLPTSHSGKGRGRSQHSRCFLQTIPPLPEEINDSWCHQPLLPDLFCLNGEVRESLCL